MNEDGDRGNALHGVDRGGKRSGAARACCYQSEGIGRAQREGEEALELQKRQMLGGMTTIPVLGKLRQENCEFEVSL